MPRILYHVWIAACAVFLPCLHHGKLYAQDSTRFADEIAAFEAEDRENARPDAPVLFVGSSSIRLWNTAEAFPDLHVLNRGFGGSAIPDVNFYLRQVVLKYRPRLIVFYAGDNDVASGTAPETVARDFRTFVDRVHAKLPGTPVVFISIKPSIARWKLWPQMQEANRLIADLASENPLVRVADIGTPMLGADGKPGSELFLDDGLHLSEAGYEVWRHVVGEVLSSIPTR